jgi:hypothetical protein
MVQRAEELLNAPPFRFDVHPPLRYNRDMKQSTRTGESKGQQDTAGTDALWSKRWERLGAANEAARRQRLRALTLERAIREFEDLCREVHGTFDKPPMPRSHPVGLVKYTRTERTSR